MAGPQNWRSSMANRKTQLNILGAIVVIGILLMIILLATLLPKKKRIGDRIECPGFSKSECVKKGCKYEKLKSEPSCYMQKDSFGYKITSVGSNESGITFQLLPSAETTPYGSSFRKVTFQIIYITENILRFKFTDDGNKQRYEVPVQWDFPLLVDKPKVHVTKLAYKIRHSNETETFSFEVLRKGDGTKLWDTKLGALVLTDKFLQIGSYVPSSYVYGFGEHVHERFRHDMNYKTWPMFSRDRPPYGGNYNLYGVHPFYTCLEANKKSHGVLFLNSNAMEVTLMPAPAILFRTTGGILDFFMFVGDNPEHVVRLYTSLIGRPIMPPYWALGFQLSKYGYDKIENLQAAVERTREASIAQDVQFLDIDHMDGNKDFTWDKKRFQDLPAYISKTKNEYGLRWIIILDPAIAANSTYSVYNSGVESGIFVKRNESWDSNMFPEDLRNNNFVYGKVWPRELVAFPDFFLDETKAWWKSQIINHFKDIQFDGLWIDMNEPANFETNKENPDYCDWEKLPKDKCWALQCPKGPYEYPPYDPLMNRFNERISDKTLCMDSVQGKDANQYLHYDVHSLYGWSQTQPTLEAVQSVTETRSLVISRSTYPSSGRYAGHWLGDNQSIWPDLHRSVIGMLEFNLFGIPYIGADVCGFNGDSNAELCKRWMQLGAFYPFFRNHNAINQKDQDPAVFGKEIAQISKYAVERRYNLNPYLYTLFYRAHVDGSTVIRPLFHEFAEDKLTWDIDKQFMWGKWLLISPVLKNERSLSLYLPKDEWWYFAYEKSRLEAKSGQYITATDTQNYIPMHVRGGAILPLEKYELKTTVKPAVSRNITLYVFPKNNEGTGELFVDDGLSRATIENRNYMLYTFSNRNCILTIKKSDTVPTFTGSRIFLDAVIVFKVRNASFVYADEQEIQFKMNDSYNVLTATVQKDMESIQNISWKGIKKSCDMLP